MSKKMKKVISKVLVCCMLLSVAYPTVTASAEEADQKEGYRVTFVTNGSKVELDGKEIKDGDVLTTYESPSGWIETKGWFEDSNGFEVDVNDINRPEVGPVKWQEITFEHKVDGSGAVKFRVPEGNPYFEIEGDYDWMNYYGNSVFEIIGISEDLTVNVKAPYMPADDFEDYSTNEDEEPVFVDEDAEKENKDYSVKFVVNDSIVTCDGKEIKDGDTVTTHTTPSSWIETEGWFVDGRNVVVDESEINDPDKGPVKWVENKKEIHGDGDGAVAFTVQSEGPGLIMITVDGEYDHMGYTGSGVFEIIGISEDVTVNVDSHYGADEELTEETPAVMETYTTDKKLDADVKAPAPKILGDVNGDDKASAKDSMMVQRFTVGLVELDDTQKQNADVDGNGKVTNADALNIMRYTVNADVKYPIGETK